MPPKTAVHACVFQSFLLNTCKHLVKVFLFWVWFCIFVSSCPAAAVAPLAALLNNSLQLCKLTSRFSGLLEPLAWRSALKASRAPPTRSPASQVTYMAYFTRLKWIRKGGSAEEKAQQEKATELTGVCRPHNDHVPDVRMVDRWHGANNFTCSVSFQIIHD